MDTDFILEVLEHQVTDARRARLRAVCDRRMTGLTIALENLYDDGNRSAVYRSAEAFGLLDVHVVNPAATNKKNARAVSRGAEKWLRIHEHADADSFVAAMHRNGMRVAVSDLESGRPLSSLPFDKPTALVFGSEHSGITPRMRELADDAFIIPMRGFVESLNISTAAAITLAHARTERERALGALTDMRPEARDALYAHCVRLSIKSAEDQLARATADRDG